MRGGPDAPGNSRVPHREGNVIFLGYPMWDLTTAASDPVSRTESRKDSQSPNLTNSFLEHSLNYPFNSESKKWFQQLRM